MREILFKAKAINRDKGYHRTNYKNGDWVYGLITRLYDERFENLPATMTDENGVNGIEMDHNTICQYTGLTDKNGNKIWENDIVKVDVDRAIAMYSEKHSGYILQPIGDYYFDSPMIVDNVDIIDKVIGNIFDNPEMIGEQNG